MSTGHGWEGLRQVCVMLLGARHVPERLCGVFDYLGRYNVHLYIYLSPLNFIPIRFETTETWTFLNSVAQEEEEEEEEERRQHQQDDE